MKKYTMLHDKTVMFIVEVTDDDSECVLFAPAKRVALNKVWARELAQKLLDFSDGKFLSDEKPLPKWDGPNLKI